MNDKILQASKKVELEIEEKFSSSSRNRTVARSCLKLCKEWASLKQSALGDFSKSQAKKSCKKYVMDNLQEEVKGGFFVSLLFSVVIKLIIEWIIERYITSLFKNI